MLTVQMLPAGCGDALWLEYGEPGATGIVIIDGGVRDTITALRKRIETACRERNTETLEVELLVVTHIDNDHILGILELLRNPSSSLRVKNIWFNGRPQLMRLPAKAAGATLPADLLGPQQGDDLSDLLDSRKLPWNTQPIFVPDTGALPVVTLDGKLTLTLLGPTLASLYDLCAKWVDILGGDEELQSEQAALPGDWLGRSDTWPPVWSDVDRRDPSVTNGSSIMFLAEYGSHSVLLTGDGHASDLTAALERLRGERKLGSRALPLSAFKLPHHGSARNLNRALLEQVDCSRYMISTDGSTHRHPDHQALLRILRYSTRPPELLFNCEVETTRPWRDSKQDVLADPNLQNYETRFPADAEEGFVLELE